jgi:short-chain 2-methylacyl-CoA dehydrogenase
MDEISTMDPDIIKECFQNGLMGVEIDPSLGGNGAQAWPSSRRVPPYLVLGMSFTSSIIVIEELAKVDPSVSVMVDVQNTLVGIPLRKWGSEAQKKKYLPMIAKHTLGSFALRCAY